MTTLRNKLLNTDDPILEKLLNEMLTNLLCVNKGFFSYRFDVDNVDIIVEFKFDDVANISFNPNDDIRTIATSCDCIEITNLSKGSVEMISWAYDGDD